jgi:hypothetical protein
VASSTSSTSPNHVIEFPDGDPVRASAPRTCTRSIISTSSTTNEFRLLRGAYTNHIVRTAGGGRSDRLIQHISWHEAR